MAVGLKVKPEWPLLKKEAKPKEPLLTTIHMVQRELELATQKFNLEGDIEMVDAHIYEQRSLERRLDCLLKQARDKGLRVELPPRLIYHQMYE